MTTTQKPTVGRIVHYFHAVDGQRWPAIILEVTEQQPVLAHDPPGEGVELLCFLQVFRPRATEWVRAIEGTVPGTWCFMDEAR